MLGSKSRYLSPEMQLGPNSGEEFPFSDKMRVFEPRSYGLLAGETCRSMQINLRPWAVLLEIWVPQEPRTFEMKHNDWVVPRLWKREGYCSFMGMSGGAKEAESSH